MLGRNVLVEREGTHRKTNMSPEINGWKMHFLFKQSFFREHVLVFGGVAFFQHISAESLEKPLSSWRKGRCN